MKRGFCLALPLLLALSANAPAAVNGIPSHGLRRLMDVPKATRGDCLVAVAAMIAGHRTPAGHELTQLLTANGVAHPDDLDRLDQPAERGYACLLFMRAMEDDGGLLYHVFRNSERFAYKHLEFLKMIPPGGHRMPISGPELMALLSLAKARATHWYGGARR